MIDVFTIDLDARVRHRYARWIEFDKRDLAIQAKQVLAIESLKLEIDEFAKARNWESDGTPHMSNFTDQHADYFMSNKCALIVEGTFMLTPAQWIEQALDGIREKRRHAVDFDMFLDLSCELSKFLYYRDVLNHRMRVAA